MTRLFRENSRRAFAGPATGRRAAARESSIRVGRRSRFWRRAVMLLEVIVSIGLLIFGLSVVGLQMNGGLAMVREADLGVRAVMLADSKLAEFDSGFVVVDRTGDDLTGGFGISYPGYVWRIRTELTDIEDLYMLTLQVGFSEEMKRRQIDDPEYEVEEDLDFEMENIKVLRRVHRLVAKPADVNLGRDLGMEQEQIDQLTEQIPIPGFDPESLDPTSIAQLDDETLDELLPLIEQILGGGGAEEALQHLDREQREDLRDLREEYGDEAIKDAADRMGNTDGGRINSEELREELEQGREGRRRGR